jgi:anti-sigma factor RsiW
MRHLAETRWLDAYADGELRGWRRRRAERHLGACPACRLALDRLQAARGAVADALAGERPPGSAEAFWTGVRAAIAAGRPAPRPGLGELARGWLLPIKLHPAWSAGSAAAGMALLAAVGMWRSGSIGPPPDAGRPARVESVEAGPGSTVLLFSPPGSQLQVIWVFERAGS